MIIKLPQSEKLYTKVNMYRGRLTLSALGQCPWAHHFIGPTPTIHVNFKRAQIAAKIAFAQGPERVSVRP